MNKRYLTIEDVENMAYKVAKDILAHDSSFKFIRLYGVPRGGITPAALVAGALRSLLVEQARTMPIRLTSELKEATHIIDDVIDSAATLHKVTAVNNVPFYALFDKRDDDDDKEWLVFPWEVALDGVEDSGDDIPTRLLQYIGEDPTRGGLIETPKRFLKAWKTWSAGYDVSKDDIANLLKTFEDGAENYDEMIVQRNIPVYSHCEHHLAPFFGVAHIAYIPSKKIVGLSKLSRLVTVFAQRLQVQERLTNQIATALEEHLQPKGAAVVLECRHLCMESRGIQQQGTTTTTSAMKGVFLDKPGTREEFMRLISR